MPKNQAKRTRVETTVHDEAQRSNIPTTELGSFLSDQEKEPKTILYPRDPSLDPQLVWKGKEEQDRHPLEVPAVPIYIQEKIHPKALIEALRAEKASAEEQLSLWGDFNGIEFEELVEFYQHEQQWSNRMILGDSLLVMTSLAEKEGLKGEVQMIYMDPPYGIKFGSNWQVTTQKRDVQDGKVEDATRQPEQVKAFRDTWELGIHSYLSYLRDRMVVSRELLAPSGSVFVQIGDENVHLVRSLLDEVFGSDNFISLITFNKTSGQGSDFLYSISDYLLWYARDRGNAKFRRLFSEKRLGEAGATKFNLAELPDGSVQPLSAVATDGTIPKGVRLLTDSDLTGHGFATTTNFAFKFNGTTFRPKGHSRRWKTTQEGMAKLVAAGRVFERGHSLRYKRYLVDFPIFEITNTWTDVGGIQSRTDPKIYVVQTTNRVIERCILMTTDPGDLVIDPTCGSGTTAYVAEQWGRRWITIDTSRVALALARQRLMAAKLPYYVLTDSLEGARQLAQQSGRVATPDPTTSGDLRKGFVYKTVPHVTLKSIANNPDIRDGMSREDIDTAISRHADQETLYDQPHEDRKVVRVTGPFTVESLSPHVTLPLSEAPAEDGRNGPAHGDDDVERFQRVVLDHLRKAGVQNTVRSERLVFDSVEPWPGRFVHAVGTYSESGAEKRAAISIGPEYGTVDAELVHQAAREAVDFADLLIVCGFAFDGYPSGTILVWETSEDVPSRDLAIEQHTSAFGGHKLLLDGQQRLTSLSAVLRGEPLRFKNRVRPVDIAFNLDHPDGPPTEVVEVEDDEPSADLSLDDDMELNGDARSVQERVQNRTFVVSWRALLTDPHWVKVSDIFNPHIRDWDLLKKLVSSPADPLYDRYSERLQRVRKIGDYLYVMHVIERHLTYEEVAEIFVRVNSLGMKLRGSDLAMAQITARWQGSLDLFEEFAEECEKLWFSFDPGLLVRTLVVFATGQSRFRTVTSISVPTLKESWEKAKEGIRFAINFLRTNAGIEDESLLSSPLLVIPIAVLAVNQRFQLTDNDERNLLHWLFVANATGYYSRGSSETLLDMDLSTVLRRDGGPRELLDLVKQRHGRIRFSAADLAGRSSRNPLFQTAYLAVRHAGAKDWRSGLGLSLTHSGKYHYIQTHHIFPKAITQEYESSEVNEISNLAFIS